MIIILNMIYLQMPPKLYHAVRSGNSTEPKRQGWVFQPNPGVSVKPDSKNEIYNMLPEDGLLKSQNMTPCVTDESHEAYLIVKI